MAPYMFTLQLEKDGSQLDGSGTLFETQHGPGVSVLESIPDGREVWIRVEDRGNPSMDWLMSMASVTMSPRLRRYFENREGLDARTIAAPAELATAIAQVLPSVFKLRSVGWMMRPVHMPT